MKSKVRAIAARMKLVYTRPWNVRGAWINVCVWSGLSVVNVCNIALGVLVGTPFSWGTSAVNIAFMFFYATMVKLSVTGLLWRKAETERKAEAQRLEDRFYEILNAEYQRDRTN